MCSKLIIIHEFPIRFGFTESFPVPALVFMGPLSCELEPGIGKHFPRCVLACASASQAARDALANQGKAQASLGRDDIEEDASVVVLEVG